MTAFAELRGPANSYEYAPLSVFPSLTHRPFAKMEVAAQRWETFITEETGVDGVLFSTAHNAFVLQAEPTITDMALERITITEGDLALCYPPEGVSDRPGHIPAYLYAYNAAGNHHVSFTSQTVYPEAPGLLLSFVRTKMLPPDQTEDVLYRFTFGGGWILEWGLTREVKVYDPDGWLAAKHVISLNEAARFYGESHLLWEIHNPGGVLYLECSALDEPIRIRSYKDPQYREDAEVDNRYVGTLPSATIGWSATGGVHALLVDSFRYPTSGYVETDWVEHLVAFTGDPLVFLYPTPPSGTDVTVVPIATAGTKRRYRITLTGDGSHTPFLQAWQYYYPAQYAAGSGSWTDLTPAVQEVSENMPEDLASRVTELTLLNWDGSLDNMAGQMAFRYKVGYVLSDDSEFADWRMVGLLKIHRYTNAVGEHAYRATVDDRAAILAETELLNPPCLTGWYVDDAIAVLATYGGIAPTDIVVHDGVYKQLNVPQWGYDNPPWLLTTGQRCWSVVKELCDAYNVKAEFWGDGLLHIYPDVDPTEAEVVFSTEPGTDRLYTPQSVEVTSDLTNIVNCVFYQGRTEDDKPIYSVRYDYDSIYTPESPRYVGTLLMRAVTDPNLTAQGELNYTCATQYRKRKTGGRMVTLKGMTIGTGIWPGMGIAVIDANTGLDASILFKVVSVSGTPGKQRFNPHQITAVEVLGG